jgi:beta-glucosidase-like glycosyl hydrolase/CubicO group peptidase (beta-lactamase class C family)
MMLLLWIAWLPLSAQSDPFGVTDPSEAWVDSVFQSLTPEERLGQLFMIRAHSDLGADHIRSVEQQIKKYKVGGLCFFQGTPEKQVELVNQYQALSPDIPLMIAIDGEWGLGMRMKESTISFPYQLMLGAIQDNDLIYEMGKEIAYQFRRTGVTVNFAPVVDVNNNPNNPVINFRSFGEDRFNVAVKSYMYMKGMQDHGLLGCAKHFPGHGDTDVDSHLDLPVINHSRSRLDSLELYPFKVLADQNVGSMMIAHLNVPALDDRKNRPTTLSRPTVTGLLREDMGYDGLLFTDALEMKGVTKHFEAGEVEAEALVAGNDILTLPEDIGAAIREIKAYLADGRLSQEQVDASVRRVLRTKYQLGLTRYEPLGEENVRKDINRPEAEVLRRRLIRASLTLVRNGQQMVPFQNLDTLNMASLSIGASSPTVFQKRLGDYKKMMALHSSKDISEADSERLLRLLGRREVVVVSLHDMSQYARYNFGLDPSTLAFLKKLNEQTTVVLTIFGNPYSLKHFDSFDHVLVAYAEEEAIQDLAAQSLFGVFGLRGRLPVTASPLSRYNQGVYTRPLYRMGYGIPEEAGLNRDSLVLIDKYMDEAIRKHATPGGVVLVARDRQIVWHKAYGHHTYTRRVPTEVNDQFDMASITKVAASTLAMMRLQDKGLIDVDQPISTYLRELRATNKASLVIGDIMAHQAGLKSWIPFYKRTLTPDRGHPQPDPRYYRTQEEPGYSIPVSPGLYMRDDYVDTIWAEIIESDLRKNKNYRYSDLGFYLIARLVKERTGQDLDDFVSREFYRPMGLESLTFNPWQKGKVDRVVPTEEDQYYRYRRLQGYVHDMGAAMMGGVSGHAGLFGNAKDLAALMQMILDDGKYGGRQYLQPETIQKFTHRYNHSTRRGIGFDMPQLDQRYPANLSEMASENTFGHLGFTGTCVWADPDERVLYVFLSNRTFPSMGNHRLNKLDTRPRIQDQVYRALSTDKESKAISAVKPVTGTSTAGY